MTDRRKATVKRITAKGFGPHYDGAVLPGAFTQNIEAASAVALSSGAVRHQLRTEPTILGLGAGLAFTRQLSKKEMVFGEILKH